MSCSVASVLCSTSDTGVVVEAAASGPSLVVGESACQLGPSALEQREARLGREVPGEREPQREAARVVDAWGLLCVEQPFEDLVAVLGDAVHLPRPFGHPPGTGAPRTQPGPLAAQRAGGGDGFRRTGAARLGDGDRVARLEPCERRVERPEGDVGEEPELVAQPAADLVPVHLLLEEETEDGEFEHVSSDGQAGLGSLAAYDLTIYHIDISVQHIPAPCCTSRSAAARPFPVTGGSASSAAGRVPLAQ